jgi:hypothetical protein
MRRAGLIALSLLGACEAHTDTGVRPLRPLELATSTYEEAVTASMTGSLMYEDGCLLFREEGSGARLLPVWPAGSIFNGTSVIFHRPGKADQPVLVSQEIVMEGLPGQWSVVTAPAYDPFEHQCVAQPFFVSRIQPAD